METLLLQDWLTIGKSTTQGAPSYLDVSNYQDLVFYFDAKQMPAFAGVAYETAPEAEDSSFQTMASVNAATAGPLSQTSIVLGRYALIPPAKYVRWLCSTSDVMTFRIWIAAYRLP
jgi:hypothetical protein